MYTNRGGPEPPLASPAAAATGNSIGNCPSNANALDFFDDEEEGAALVAAASASFASSTSASLALGTRRSRLSSVPSSRFTAYSARRLYPSGAHSASYMFANRASRFGREPMSSFTQILSVFFASEGSEGSEGSSCAPAKWYVLIAWISRGPTTTPRSDFRKTMSVAPRSSPRHSNACPKLAAPDNAPTIPAPGSSVHGGTMNAR